MTFPLTSAPATFIRAAPTWSAVVGAAATDGEGFPAGTITTTNSTATRLLVYFHQIGNVGGRLSSLTIGGAAPTLQGQIDGWYIYTRLVSTALTGLAVSGSGGGGRSGWWARELFGYTSTTPVILTGTNVGAVSYSTETSTNFAAVGGWEAGNLVTAALSVSPGPAPEINTHLLDGAKYNVFWQSPTSRGPTTYTHNAGAAASKYLYAAWR